MVDHMTTPTTSSRLQSRTKIITAVSIGAVGLASLFAIGANFGILSNAGQSKVGTLGAAGDLLPANTKVAVASFDKQGDSPTSEPATPAGSQRFTVDSAGIIDIAVTDGVAHVAQVTPASGWTAKSPESTGTGVAVAFTNGTRSLVFTASVAANGTVSGDVTESTTSANASHYGDDEDSHKSDNDHDDDSHESDDDNDQDHDRHEYEGSESDD